MTTSVRVLHVPAKHDYVDALYGAMSFTARSAEARAIIAAGQPDRRAPSEVASYWKNFDIVHLHWPEYLVEDEYPGCERHLGGSIRVLESLERSDALVVWTMHNRAPHFWPGPAGATLYQEMARLADVVIHHSRWGMLEVVSELPYRASAIHVVIPHGHYEHILRVDSDRATCEKSLGLTPCRLRFGIVGRPQYHKRVADIARVFAATAADDHQLMVTALTNADLIPRDLRVAVRPRKGWLSREEIALQIKCCDCLVAWHDERHYLTSGLVADAIGAGIPMLVNSDWPFWQEVLGRAALPFAGEVSLRDAFASLTPAEVEQGGLIAASLRPVYDWSAIADWTAKTLLIALKGRPRRKKCF